MTQLPLEMPFGFRDGYGDFIVSTSNMLAAASVEQWPDWPGSYRALNLVGAAGAGKSHLAALWRARLAADSETNTTVLDSLCDLGANCADFSPFVVLDHIQPGPAWHEESLFHLFNRCGRSGGLLLLSDMPVGQMRWRLPDLLSRMRAVNVARIDVPDDALLRALFEKFFMVRQIVPPPAMLDYLVGRMERSFDAVNRIGQALDRLSIAEKRPLSVALAREVLRDFQP